MKELLAKQYMTYLTPFDDGADDGADAGADAGADDGGNSDKGKPATFTQADVDKMLQDEKRKLEKKNGEQIKNLQALQKRSQLSEADKEALESQIEHLQDQGKTKEELSKKAAKKTEREYNEKLDKITKEHSSLKVKYDEGIINRALADAASATGVDTYKPALLTDILRKDTQLVELFDADGDSIGRHARVKIQSVTEDGKPITLDLSPAEAVKHIKERGEDDFLFKGQGTGGMGKNNQGKGKSDSLADIAKSGNMADYKKARLAQKRR